MNKVIYFASDHAGFPLKEYLKNFLLSKEILYKDVGCDSIERCDYPDYAHKLAEKMKMPNAVGVAICRTGIGMSIALNRHKAIRAARCTSIEDAELSRQHNDANVLVLGARQTNEESASEILNIFLQTDFEGGRHVIRIDKIEQL